MKTKPAPPKRPPGRPKTQYDRVTITRSVPAQHIAEIDRLINELKKINQ